MNGSPDISIYMAFFVGIASFASPCVLPLIPGYLSFISGISVNDLGRTSTQNRVRVIAATLLFVLGFTIIFVALGASAGFLGSWLISYRAIFMKIAGIVIIIFALFSMELIKIPKLYETKRLNMGNLKIGIWGALPLGAAFGFAWTPCVGPYLGTILSMAATTSTVNQGTLLLSVYALGLGIPFIATALFFNTALGAFQWIKKNFRTINIISGILLLIMGILILTGYLNIINNYIQGVGS
ncbi:MAG: cytochrome c biogenesis protein CcdA [Firmicutes bacterium]|nr:cytochrome c biogenesis protein CcdA [Bacillota bacterium]